MCNSVERDALVDASGESSIESRRDRVRPQAGTLPLPLNSRLDSAYVTRCFPVSVMQLRRTGAAPPLNLFRYLVQPRLAHRILNSVALPYDLILLIPL